MHKGALAQPTEAGVIKSADRSKKMYRERTPEEISRMTEVEIADLREARRRNMEAWYAAFSGEYDDPPFQALANRGKFLLWYDNGTGWFDCASQHDDLDAAIRAAKSDWQETRQYITTADENEIVWRNYEEEK